MPKKSATPSPPDDSAVWTILQQTSAETGQKYFEGLVLTLSRLLNTCGAWVTEFHEEEQRLKAFAFWMDGKWIENYETGIAGTPCETVIHTADLVHIPERLLELYPHSKEARAGGFVSYLGVPLKDSDGGSSATWRWSIVSRCRTSRRRGHCSKSSPSARPPSCAGCRRKRPCATAKRSSAAW